MRPSLNLALGPSQGLLRGQSLQAFCRSLLAILHNCLFSFAEDECLFTGSYFLSALFEENMLKEANRYKLLRFGEASGKSVLFTGFILLWGGIVGVLLKKCLGEAHTRVIFYRMENYCGVCLKTPPQTSIF